MAKHIFFLFVYFIGANFLSAEALLAILVLHSFLGLMESVSNKTKVSLLSLIYVGIIVITLSNINLIVTTSNGGESIYTFLAPAYINEAALIWCIGSTSMFIGYQIFIKKALPSVAIIIDNKKILKNIFIFEIAIGLNSLLHINLPIPFLGIGQVVKFLTLLSIVSILIFARLWTKENNKMYGIYALILCVDQEIYAITTSYLRSEIIIPVISLFAGYFLGKGSPKYLFTYRIIPFLIAFALFYQLFRALGNNRANFTAVITQSQNDDESALGEQHVTYENENENTEEKGGVFDRSSNLAQITNCVKLVKNNGLYNGKVSEPLLYALIPRFLWADKPSIRLGTWFAVEIGAAYVAPDGTINNSVNMTIPGELYLDFGWIGIMIGCILFGGLMAAFWNSSGFHDSPYNAVGTMWGGYLLLLSLGNFGADLQIVVTLISTYIVFLALRKVIGKTI